MIWAARGLLLGGGAVPGRQVGCRVGQVDRQPVAARLDPGEVAGLAGEVRVGADDVAEEHLTERMVQARVGAAFDRVLEGLRGDRLVRGRREAHVGPDRERVRAAVLAHRGERAGGVGNEASSSPAGLVGIVEQHRAGRVPDPGSGAVGRDRVVERRHVRRGAHDSRPAARVHSRWFLMDARPDLPAAYRQRLRAASDLDLLGDLLAALVDPEERAVPTVCHPDAVAVGRDRSRSAPDRDRPDPRVGGRVDRIDGAVQRVRDPDGALPDCNRGRSPADRNRRDRSRGIDADDQVGLAIGQPRAPEPERSRSRSGIRVQLP